MYLQLTSGCHCFSGSEARVIPLEVSPLPSAPRLTFLEMARTGMTSGFLGLLEFWVLLFHTGAHLHLCAG